MADQFPAGFTSRLRDGAFSVLDEVGETLVAVDARWLAAKLLRGETCNARERAVAGAALLHLMLADDVLEAKVAELAAMRRETIEDAEQGERDGGN